MSNHASRVGIGLKMSRHEIAEAAHLRARGMAWREIGARFDVAPSTARRTVLAHGEMESGFTRHFLRYVESRR